MTLIERYIFRMTLAAFALTLVSLTSVIIVTQALRRLNLVTSKGQTILVFLDLTAQSIPLMVMQISPFALFIAVLYVLNKLNGDSELIVMNAAGIRPRQLLRPFAILSVLVAIMVGVMTLVVMPQSARRSLDLLNKIRADVVSRIIEPGRFTWIEDKIAFHYKEKADQTLLGLLIQDRRDPNRISTYLADRGEVIESGGKPYLILEKGSVHRQSPTQSDNSIIAFDRYMLDMEQLGGSTEGRVELKPAERTTYELMFPDPKDEFYRQIAGRMRAELHQRFVSILSVFASLAVAFAACGAPRTTRQGQGWALGLANLAIGASRIATFAVFTMVARNSWAVPVYYGLPIATVLVSMLIFFWQNDARTRRMMAPARLRPASSLARPHRASLLGRSGS
jgi:lipopolysaccharide export system permease protein